MLHKGSISSHNPFHTILHLQNIQEFRPPSFLYLLVIIPSCIIRHHNIKFFHIDKSCSHIDIF